MKKLLFSLASAGLAICLASSAAAQTTPVPSPQATTQSSAPEPTITSTPMHSVATPAPAPKKRGLLNQLKRLIGGALSSAQVKYAVTHQSQELAKLKRMKTVPYSSLRFYKIPPSMLPSVNAWRSQQAYEPFQLNDQLAQSSNPFLDIFANVVVTNALNNILNSNTVSVSLNDVLNANKIAVGQVVGLFINGGGIITTIIK